MAGWQRVLLTAILGLVMVGLSFGQLRGKVVIGPSHGFVLPIGALGVALCVLAAFAFRDLLHGRRQVRYWQQHRRAH